MKQYYVMQGDPDKNEWANYPPLGPFHTQEQATAAIRADSLAWMDGDEHELGRHDDWCQNYRIVEVIKTIKPVIAVSAKVYLKHL